MGLELMARAKDGSLFERAMPLMQAEARSLDAALGALVSGKPPAA